MAIYAEAEGTDRKGEDYYIPHIVAVSKQDPPDKELIIMPRSDITPILNQIEPFIPRVYEVWQGKVKPQRCGKCDYCRSTKKLKEAVHYMEIGL